jgi:kynureninase
VPALCDNVCSLLGSSDAELVLCDVRAVVDPDVAAADALARLQLATRRLGRRMLVRNASADFTDLLVLMGLGEVLPLGLRLEVGRQPEEREERLGVEEERELADPAV